MGAAVGVAGEGFLVAFLAEMGEELLSKQVERLTLTAKMKKMIMVIHRTTPARKGTVPVMHPQIQRQREMQATLMAALIFRNMF